MNPFKLGTNYADMFCRECFEKNDLHTAIAIVEEDMGS